MKSYLFTTKDDRGGVILCDIDTLEEVVPYLQQRFKGVVRVEQGRTEWTAEGGFAEFTPRPVSEIGVEAGSHSVKGQVGSVEQESLHALANVQNQAENLSAPTADEVSIDAFSAEASAEARGQASTTASDESDASPTGSLF